MKLILQIAAGIILAVLLIVGVIAVGHVKYEQKEEERQDTEFCKKAKDQGMTAADLKRMGCQQ